MAEVFLCEKGQLTQASKTALRKAGVVVAEVEDITRCQFMRSSEVVSADDMLWATVDALNHTPNYGEKGTPQRVRLARNLLTVIDAARERQKASGTPAREAGDE